jgi:hypothetical protein
MELSENGLTSWGQLYKWTFGGNVTLYRDAYGGTNRLVTRLNTRSGMPFETEYTDDEPVILSPTERREWDGVCQKFLIAEQDIYDRMLEELRWYVGEQVRDIRSENPQRRVIPADEYDQMYSGARNAVASALSVTSNDIGSINYEEGANVIDFWLGDLLEAEGYILEED